MTLDGKSRAPSFVAPGDLMLQDFRRGRPRARHARGLAARDQWPASDGASASRTSRGSIRSLLTGLSRDGRRILFTQFGSSVDTDLRGLRAEARGTEPDARRRGFRPGAFSGRNPRPRDRCRPLRPSSSSVRPRASAGQPMKIAPRGLEAVMWADWFPDGDRIVVAGTGADGRTASRLYVCDPESGETRAISPEGILIDHYQGVPVSPDGRRVAGASRRRPARGLLRPTAARAGRSRTCRPAWSRSPGPPTAAAVRLSPSSELPARILRSIPRPGRRSPGRSSSWPTARVCTACLRAHDRRRERLRLLVLPGASELFFVDGLR